MAGTRIGWAELGYQAPGHRVLELRNDGDEEARLLVLGGEPLGEQVIMWWNFMGRTHEEIVAYREQWQAEIGEGESAERRFGQVDGYDGAPLPAPVLPNSRLRPRG